MPAPVVAAPWSRVVTVGRVETEPERFEVSHDAIDCVGDVIELIDVGGSRGELGRSDHGFSICSQGHH